MSEKFPAKVARSTKQTRGRSEQTPIAFRSSIPITASAETRMRRKLTRRLGHASSLLQRGTVRFDDINGPRGGVDKRCRIKLVLSGRPSVQVGERASDIEPAFDRASFKAQRALARVQGKHGLSAGRPRKSTNHSPAKASTRAKAAASSQRTDSPPERNPMKLKTARRPPARRATKVKARRAKHRVGMQRSR